MTDRLLYYLARVLVACLQALPLTWAARAGRVGGALAYWLDARHRRVALRNLAMCFGSVRRPAEIRALARENFRRIGENYVCAVNTATLSREELCPFVEFGVDQKVMETMAGSKPQNVVVALGHFGNFEFYGRGGWLVPGYRFVTTYRSLRQPLLNHLMQSLRAHYGCELFERRTDGAALRATMHQPRTMLGLLADQHAGQGGLRLPFLGHDCSTSAAPAIFARRYRCRLFVAICYRVALARWRIEPGPEIPTHERGAPRSTEAIMLDVNRALEAAVLRDPANWFWVHNRWRPSEIRSPRSTVEGRAAKSESLESAPKTEAGG